MLKFVVCLVLLPIVVFGSQQRIVIKGVVRCGDKPYEGATVKLVDKDTISMDDKMGEMKTGKDGSFYLDGTSSETTSLDPVLKIYHDCDDTLLGVPIPCQRRWAFKLPKNIVQSPGAKNPAVFDWGEYNLEMRTQDEEHDCLH